MAARLSTVVIDSHVPQALAGFWCDVLGWRVKGTEEDGSVEIGDADSAVTLLFEPAEGDKNVKNRLHIDVSPVGVDQHIELQRLLTHGARPVDIGQGDQTWVVLADPEGNEFCLLQDRKD